eukprot:scaffold35661_cov67-Cyclotella_meneghiniana.AAC.5
MKASLSIAASQFGLGGELGCHEGAAPMRVPRVFNGARKAQHGESKADMTGAKRWYKGARALAP